MNLTAITAENVDDVLGEVKESYSQISGSPLKLDSLSFHKRAYDVMTDEDWDTVNKGVADAALDFTAKYLLFSSTTPMLSRFKVLQIAEAFYNANYPVSYEYTNDGTDSTINVYVDLCR